MTGHRKHTLYTTIAILAGIVCLSATYVLINSYNTRAQALVTDNFGNFYTVAANRILKFSREGKYLYPYEEFRYGKIGTVDVTNPMKILVYYPDFLTVVTLDRFLSPLTTYNFFELGYQNVTAVASSVDGRIWYYDNVDFKLKKIDETGKVFRESQPLNVVLEKAPNPHFMVEKDNQLYMNDSTMGILVFDFFGSYGKTLPLKGLRKFQVLQGQIIYGEGNNLKSYNPATFEWKEIALPDTSGVVQAAIENERIGILKNDRVDFYRY